MRAKSYFFFLVVFFAGAFFVAFLVVAFLAMALYLLSQADTVRPRKKIVNKFFPTVNSIFALPPSHARATPPRRGRIPLLTEEESRGCATA
ncbi:MAG TPA: hypothetical protein VHY37_07040 [Tepidisphaeraceae bacterium]|jgi:hypothetical protein|nr:hypothetical protein [Tepidisphaeraceae bacterium]